MPALPDVPQVLRITLQLSNSAAAREARVREFWQYTGGPPTDANLDTLATALQTAWGTHIKPVTHQDWSLLDVEIIDLTSPTAAQGLGSGGVQAGSLTGKALPIPAALLWEGKVHRRYRGGHPRGYWPMGDSTYTTDGERWDATPLANMESDINAYHAVVAGASVGSGTMVGRVNVSYYEGFTVVEGSTGRAKNVAKARTTAVVDAITSEGPNSLIGTQRRRRGKV